MKLINKNNKKTLEADNWYAKLHPIGVNETQKPRRSKRRRMLNLSLFFRIWLAVGIIIIISGVVVFKQLFNYVRPTTQQVIEDTLVDTAKFLSASLQTAVETRQIYDPEYQAKLDNAFKVPDSANQLMPSKSYVNRHQLNTLSTWYTHKTHSSFRVYITDASGIVIYDSLSDVKEDNDIIALNNNSNEQTSNSIASSELLEAKGEVSSPSTPDALVEEPSIVDRAFENVDIFSEEAVQKLSDSQIYGYTNAEGQDYSRWRDVFLTLKGKYGARTTRKDPNEPSSSVMYVAQPIYSSDPNSHNIIGVVSVGKPTATILPYLNATRQRMLTTSLIISLICLIMAGLVAWWLKQSMKLVTRYTKSLAQDAQKPYFYLGKELNDLTATIESMKHRLENRAYVTDYVHTLTHELKSPLTAIRASGELLEASDLDDEDRMMLSHTITDQSVKLQSLIDRLLLLAKIEQPTFKLAIQPIDPNQLILKLINDYMRQPQNQGITIDFVSLLSDASQYSQNLKDDDQSQKLDQNQPLLANNTVNVETKRLDVAKPNKKEVNANDVIYADEFWLTQALQNLLDNALYFAQNLVTVFLNKQTFNKVDYVEIVIVNDGDTIPIYALEKIFDRYFSLSHQYVKKVQQGDKTTHLNDTNHGRKGTGLGLTLVKQVIERHGGYISITNVTNLSEMLNSFGLNQQPNRNQQALSVIKTNYEALACKTGVKVAIHLPIQTKHMVM